MKHSQTKESGASIVLFILITVFNFTKGYFKIKVKLFVDNLGLCREVR